MNAFHEMTPKAAAATYAPTRLIDIREPSDFIGALGHVPGAESVPIANLAERSRHWNKQTEIVLVCDSGTLSSLAAAMLIETGFEHVCVMSGGMRAYAAARLPIARMDP